jgi:hypothetical protein
MNIKNIAFIILCITPSIISARIPALFIENYYGSTIICKINNQTEKRINSDYKPVLLGNVSLKEQTVPNSVNSLSIATDYSKFISLDNILKQVSQEASKNSEKDAVLIVKSSGYLSQWDIEPRWLTPNTIIDNFSMQSSKQDEKTIERQLQTGKISKEKFLNQIEQELYGQEYAKKVKILHTLDYKKIQQTYYNNLEIYSKLKSFGYSVLLNIIGGIQDKYKDYLKNPKAQWAQVGNIAPDEVRNFVKKHIDSQYQLYLTYKNNGWLE